MLIILINRFLHRKAKQPVKVDLANVLGNVVFYVDGTMYHAKMGFFNLRINNMAPIQVFPRVPVGLELEPGVHSIFVTYPHEGKEKFPASTQIHVQPSSKYEVCYTYPLTVFSPSKLSIQIIK